MEYFKHNGADVKDQYYVVKDDYAAQIRIDKNGDEIETEMDVGREHFSRSCYSPIKEEDIEATEAKKTGATKSASKKKDE
jgi:hypothetical protein|tara:strand:- start:7371 stop:7610 length:240 start_codon:yes stop_codon:yes gene_type:complete